MEEIFKGKAEDVEKLFDVIKLTRDETGGGEMERKALEARVGRFID